MVNLNCRTRGHLDEGAERGLTSDLDGVTRQREPLVAAVSAIRQDSENSGGKCTSAMLGRRMRAGPRHTPAAPTGGSHEFARLPGWQPRGTTRAYHVRHDFGCCGVWLASSSSAASSPSAAPSAAAAATCAAAATATAAAIARGAVAVAVAMRHGPFVGVGWV